MRSWPTAWRLADPSGGGDTLGTTSSSPSRRHAEGSATASGWPDNTASNYNRLYVLGNGFLKTGWFGNLSTAGKLTTWDPNTGGPGTMTSAQLATYGSSAVAYAIAKGDARRVQDFNGTPPQGAIVLQTT